MNLSYFLLIPNPTLKICPFSHNQSAAMVKYLRSSSGSRIPRPRSTGTEKVVILIRSHSGFGLYVVDLDLDLNLESDLVSEVNYSLIKPRIQNRIPDLGDSIRDRQLKDGFHEWEGCVVNSTLYMFQQFDKKWNYSDYQLDTYFPDFKDKKQVRKFHLSPDFLNSDESMLNSSEFLEPNEIPIISQFESCAPMKWLKNSPVAVPTPDGSKILVFDRVIDFKRAHTCFELYDPCDDSWTQLKPPAFPKGFSDRELFNVRTYAFVDESTFWLCTFVSYEYCQFQFTLDLNPEKENNDSFPNSYGRLFPKFHSVTIDGPRPGPGPVTISPGMVYRHEGGDVRRFELSPVPNVPRLLIVLPKPFITLLHKQEHVYADTLVSHLHYKDDSYFDITAYLVIDAFRTRLDTKTLDTTLFGTLKYKVEDLSGIKSIYVFVV